MLTQFRSFYRCIKIFYNDNVLRFLWMYEIFYNDTVFMDFTGSVPGRSQRPRPPPSVPQSRHVIY
jgi:hypothetical protein